MDRFFYCPHNKYRLLKEQCENRKKNKNNIESWNFCKRCRHILFKTKLKRRNPKIKLKRRKVKLKRRILR